MTDTMFTLPAVRDALDRSADPLLARARLARRARGPSVARAASCATTSCWATPWSRSSTASTSLFGALERDPVAVAGCCDRTARERSTTRRSKRGRCSRSDDPARALRQWKRQQLVRIAGRDLLAIADLREVGSELSDLAQACLDVAVASRRRASSSQSSAWASSAAHELNYSSDVDVMFVHEGDQSEADACARAVLTTMSRPTAGRDRVPHRRRRCGPKVDPAR